MNKQIGKGFIIGRENFATTIYVQKDCKNNCKFCVSKDEYRNAKCKGLDEKFLRLINKSPYIKDVVFTGGEPMEDLEFVEKCVELLFNKNIYINTTLLNKNIIKFAVILSKYSQIKGINVSRHETSFALEQFNNIVEDDIIGQMSVPVKLNCVLPKDLKNLKDFIQDVVKRWSSYSNVSVCFREDFTKTTDSTLHTKNHEVINIMSSLYDFVNRSYCDVCDSTYFDNNGQSIVFHRGLQESSIEIGNKIIVNDLIVFPDGKVAYDWDRKDKNIEELYKYLFDVSIFDILPKETSKINNKPSLVQPNCGYSNMNKMTTSFKRSTTGSCDPSVKKQITSSSSCGIILSSGRC